MTTLLRTTDTLSSLTSRCSTLTGVAAAVWVHVRYVSKISTGSSDASAKA
jgi:hypothetical protein